MKIEDMKERKRIRGLTYEMIAEGSGVSLGTVKKIFGGYVTSPRYETIEALEKYFYEGERHLAEYIKTVAEPTEINDVSFDYFGLPLKEKPQGEYTIADLEEFPEDVQVELIDGYIFCQASPTPIHQKIAIQIGMALISYIAEKKGKCEAGVAATDFKLDPGDDKTMVQPDVFVVCDDSKFGLKRMTGAPDLAIELKSPSNTSSYMTKKLCKYQETGVREYWNVDYEAGKIIVYNFETNITGFYNVRDRIPVGIFEDLEIDFAKIDDEVQNYIQRCQGRE